VVELHLKVIFCLLISPKFEFVKFEKAMFQTVARHWEFLFFLLTSSKCDLGKDEKAMFQKFPCQFELIYGLLPIPKCDFLCRIFALITCVSYVIPGYGINCLYCVEPKNMNLCKYTLLHWRLAGF